MALDEDLASLQEVRDKLKRARAARLRMETATQEECDRWAEAVALAGRRNAERLAKLAVEESGFGVVAGKTLKNIFSTEFTWERIKHIRTAGIINRDEKRKIIEIAHPAGLVAAVIPITNPTSTALFKCLIAMKARCSIVVSPHPRGVRCIGESCRVAYEAAREAGAPEGCIEWLEKPTIESTQHLMSHRWTSIILATGGPGLVDAAYSSGKPALGVGPGNAPAYIHKSADLEHAVRCVLLGQVFDNGTICASEQSVIIDRDVEPLARAIFTRRGAHYCTPQQIAALEKVVNKRGHMNPDVVGQYPFVIARMAGFEVPRETTVLLCPYGGVGEDYPLSIEKLCPLLTYYVAQSEAEALDLCVKVQSFGGLGHTASIHATEQRAIETWGLRVPAFRLCVNSPTTQGSIGFTTNVDPSMTLGCGTPGGNIVADNIGPLHLVNIKRLAYVNEEILDEAERKDIAYRRMFNEPQLPWAGYGQATPPSRLPPPNIATPPPSAPAPAASAGAGSRPMTAGDIEAILARHAR